MSGQGWWRPMLCTVKWVKKVSYGGVFDLAVEPSQLLRKLHENKLNNNKKSIIYFVTQRFVAEHSRASYLISNWQRYLWGRILIEALVGTHCVYRSIASTPHISDVFQHSFPERRRGCNSTGVASHVPKRGRIG